MKTKSYLKLGKFKKSTDFLLDIEGSKDVFDDLEIIGRNAATREDFIQIGFIAAIEMGILKKEVKKKKKR